MPYDIYQRDNNRRNQLPEHTGYIVPVEPQQQQMPQIDTSDAINSLAGLLVTPEEREARQRKLMENKRKMIGWTALFDGLRQMANLYTASRGANNMQFTDNPYQTIENAYRQEQQIQDGMDKYRDSYAKTIYNMQRQADQDKMRQEAQKAQIELYKAREDDLKERRRQADEKNQAYINYYKALEDKNVEQAAYWKAKADGYTDELASIIARNEAQAEKYRKQGDAAGKNGKSGSDTETTTTSGFDENGNPVKKVVKRALNKQGKSTGNSSRTYENTKKLGL